MPSTADARPGKFRVLAVTDAGRSDRSMTVWPFGEHGGCGSDPPVQPPWLRERRLAPEL
ncbi:hypothetical protein HYE82_11670 [Streptomyces sp. BR123]|uniref:hypothetical protein n=1 Tax=Streptomyces sp. BR123 TaxID=2749828 RepID=UPI0015C43F80|nr:hypothetical protein [Streptomyces sp. BR123]NXY95044.1 hypothetical protein [Streptomyces sp. BR123]